MILVNSNVISSSDIFTKATAASSVKTVTTHTTVAGIQPVEMSATPPFISPKPQPSLSAATSAAVCSTNSGIVEVILAVAQIIEP